MIGSLIRATAQQAAEDRNRFFASSPYTDIQPAHAQALQPLWDYPEGARVTTLAKLARITKQSMSALVDDLAKRGYVERVPDPDDARATLVLLSTKGREFAKFARVFARDYEKDWIARIGSKRFDDLKSALQALNASWQADDK
jgi:DNA-binding MarR family transcriptional regulator